MLLHSFVSFKTGRGGYDSPMPLSALYELTLTSFCLFLIESLTLAARPARRALPGREAPAAVCAGSEHNMGFNKMRSPGSGRRRGGAASPRPHGDEAVGRVDGGQVDPVIRLGSAPSAPVDRRAHDRQERHLSVMTADREERTERRTGNGRTVVVRARDPCIAHTGGGWMPCVPHVKHNGKPLLPAVIWHPRDGNACYSQPHN